MPSQTPPASFMQTGQGLVKILIILLLNAIISLQFKKLLGTGDGMGYLNPVRNVLNRGKPYMEEI
jgi:hypothetical protein